MPGNTLSLEQRLNNGCATGALVLCVGGARFRVTVGEKGRGLVAARDVQKGETLCRLPGRLVDARTAPAGAEVFLVRKALRRGAPARWLVLDPATAHAPGNLANTSVTLEITRGCAPPGACKSRPERVRNARAA